MIQRASGLGLLAMIDGTRMNRRTDPMIGVCGQALFPGLDYSCSIPNFCPRGNEMLNLEQKRNRLVFMVMSMIISIALTAVMFQGINAVGILLAAGIINIFVYYALPGRYSEAYSKRYLNRR